jgi:hypothetical protein
MGEIGAAEEQIPISMNVNPSKKGNYY